MSTKATFIVGEHYKQMQHWYQQQQKFYKSPTEPTDPSRAFPTDPGKQQALVKQIFDAMLDLTSILEEKEPRDENRLQQAPEDGVDGDRARRQKTDLGLPAGKKWTPQVKGVYQCTDLELELKGLGPSGM